MAIPREPFSKRFAVSRPAPKVEPTEVPEAVRVKLVPLIDEFRSNGLSGAYTLGPALYESLGKTSPQSTGDMHMIRALFKDAEWWEVYELAETLVRMCRDPERIAERIESIFAEAGAPYRMTVDGIAWRFTAPATEAVDDAERILVEGELLKGPAQQWQKALHHLAERPPDTHNAIKDAIGAVEGTVRILSGKNQTLSVLIKPLAQDIGMHPVLASVAEKLYAYRGDEGAVAHGATAELEDLDEEAELVLHVSAALIVYLAKKSGCA